MKTRFNFDVSTLEGLEESFARERKRMTIWDWEIGGYKALYESNKKRLLKNKEQNKLKKK